MNLVQNGMCHNCARCRKAALTRTIPVTERCAAEIAHTLWFLYDGRLHGLMSEDTAMVPTLFFFGTLRDETVLRIVLGSGFDHTAMQAGHLPGHRTELVHEEDFPMLVPDAGRSVPGILVSRLTETDLDRINYFEDIDYILSPFDILCENVTETAHLYVATEEIQPSGIPWHYEQWSESDRVYMRLLAEEHMALYGDVPAEEVDNYWPETKARADRRFSLLRKSA